MRALKTVLNQKPRNSKFFEYFIKKYGDIATRDVGYEEIAKNLRSLYFDIAYGNINQDKYLNYLYGDPRIMQYALKDVETNFFKSKIIYEAVSMAQASGSPNVALPHFNTVLQESHRRFMSYSILYNAIYNFINTPDATYVNGGNPNYLVSAAAQFNNPMSGSNSVLL